MQGSNGTIQNRSQPCEFSLTAEIFVFVFGILTVIYLIFACVLIWSTHASHCLKLSKLRSFQPTKLFHLIPAVVSTLSILLLYGQEFARWRNILLTLESYWCIGIRAIAHANLISASLLFWEGIHILSQYKGPVFCIRVKT